MFYIDPRRQGRRDAGPAEWNAGRVPFSQRVVVMAGQQAYLPGLPTRAVTQRLKLHGGPFCRAPMSDVDDRLNTRSWGKTKIWGLEKWLDVLRRRSFAM